MAVIAFVLGSILGALCSLIGAIFFDMTLAACFATYLGVSVSAGALLIARQLCRPPARPPRLVV